MDIIFCRDIAKKQLFLFPGFQRIFSTRRENQLLTILSRIGPDTIFSEMTVT